MPSTVTSIFEKIFGQRTPPATKEISPGIFLIREESEDGTSVAYHLDVGKNKRVHFDIDFRGSTNLHLSGGGLATSCIVNPYEKREVARLFCKSPSKGWKIKVQFKWEEQDPASALPGTPKSEEIAPDIFVRTTRVDRPCLCFTYELDVMKFKQVRFTADFKGSRNFELITGGLKKTTVVLPYQRVEVAKLVIHDPTRPWSLKVKFKWEEHEPESTAGKLAAQNMNRHNRSASINRVYVKGKGGRWGPAHEGEKDKSKSVLSHASAYDPPSINAPSSSSSTTTTTTTTTYKSDYTTKNLGTGGDLTKPGIQRAQKRNAAAPWVSVHEFLCDLGLKQYHPKFVQEAITMELMLSMASDPSSLREILKELGISKVGHREMMIAALAKV